jgi:hypothetical protein
MMDSSGHARTAELLTRALESQPGEKITIGEFLDPLGERAFGFLLLILAIPNFIPVPVGVGGVMGVLVIYVGGQMLLGFEHPWLLRAMREHGMARKRVEKFVARLTPLLRWLEHLCRPRLEALTRRPWRRISGLLLVATGVLLALPIPFTNYVFGVLLVLYAVALIERDGAALIVAWLASLAGAIVLLTLSGAAIEAVRKMLS